MVSANHLSMGAKNLNSKCVIAQQRTESYRPCRRFWGGGGSSPLPPLDVCWDGRSERYEEPATKRDAFVRTAYHHGHGLDGHASRPARKIRLSGPKIGPLAFASTIGLPFLPRAVRAFPTQSSCGVSSGATWTSEAPLPSSPVTTSESSTR